MKQKIKKSTNERQPVSFQIEGGTKLRGAISVKTSKNAAVGLLAASLVNRGRTVLKQMPRIEEVSRMIEVIQSIGVKTEWRGNDLAIQPPKIIAIEKIDKATAEKTRAAFMLIGPLVHFFKDFKLPQAGGCKLGERSIRSHQYALEELGVKIKTFEDHYRISAKKLSPSYVVLYESGDTVTENVLTATALLPGKTTIKFASANYQVQDVCLFLQKLGVRIEGLGTTTLIVHGKKEINKDIEFYPSQDPIEAMLFVSLAILTGSAITIKGVPRDFMELELLTLSKMGFHYKITKKYKAKNGFTELIDIKTFPSKLTAPEEKIAPKPFPGINIDNLPFFVPIAAHARGETLIHDWVYEGRALYYKELEKLGADIKLADPHRVFIKGPTRWRAADITSPPALRPAAIILAGMLASRGTSYLRNIYSIARGYENLAERLSKLGAKIKVI